VTHISQNVQIFCGGEWIVRNTVISYRVTSGSIADGDVSALHAVNCHHGIPRLFKPKDHCV